MQVMTEIPRLTAVRRVLAVTRIPKLRMTEDIGVAAGATGAVTRILMRRMILTTTWTASLA